MSMAIYICIYAKKEKKKSKMEAGRREGGPHLQRRGDRPRWDLHATHGLRNCLQQFPKGSLQA